MTNSRKKSKKVIPPKEMIRFSWGGRTQEWEEEADQIMNILQDQIDNQESEKELKKKIDYGEQKQYW